MSRFIPPIAALAVLSFTSAARAQDQASDPAPAASAAPATASWVGALVTDNRGKKVGRIDGIVHSPKGVFAQINVRGSRHPVPVETLTMRDDGSVTSTMSAQEIRLSEPG
ncbi:MAG: hypothetical protein JWP35_4826 [Caulobacter sp.]|nr:hypothetical protein [Caulobacter sp.]